MWAPCRRVLPQVALVLVWAACFVGLWRGLSWKAHLLVFSSKHSAGVSAGPARVPSPTQGRWAYATLDVTPKVCFVFSPLCRTLAHPVQQDRWESPTLWQWQGVVAWAHSLRAAGAALGNRDIDVVVMTLNKSTTLLPGTLELYALMGIKVAVPVYLLLAARC